MHTNGRGASAPTPLQFLYVTCRKCQCLVVSTSTEDIVGLTGVCLECHVCEQVQFPPSTTLHLHNLTSLAQDLDDLQVWIFAVL